MSDKIMPPVSFRPSKEVWEMIRRLRLKDKDRIATKSEILEKAIRLLAKKEKV